jgi:transcription elongation factor GreA-like protein
MTMFYYRLAIERYIKNRSVKKVEELWNRMIKMVADDPKFIATIASKIRDVMGDEKVGTMVFDDVVKPAMKDENFKLALEVLKVVVNYKPADKAVRKALEECYRNLYADHSQLEKYLKASAIGQSWKPYKEAIRIFESHIAFDNGSYVSHKNWGIGIVKDISNDSVVIDFDSKKDHMMSLEIALRALNVLDDDNIVIWKKFKIEELKKLLADDPLKVIEYILRSQGGEAASKDIKATIVPEVLSEREWTGWWTDAKKAMEASNTVVMSLTKRNVIELRDTDVTVLEELVSRFKKTTNFDNKVKILIDYKNRGGDINEPGSAAIVSYFIEILQASSENSERKVIAYCSLRFANYAAANENLIDASVLFNVKNIVDLYNNIDIDLKDSFLALIQHRLKDWDVRYGAFVINTPITRYHNKMIKILIDYTKFEVVNSVFSTIINRFHEDPEAFLWAAKIVIEDQFAGLKDNIGIRDSEIIMRLITLLDILNNEIEQKSNVGRNKKVMSGIHEIFSRKISSATSSSPPTNSRPPRSIRCLDGEYAEKDISAEYENKLLAKYPQLREAPRQERVNIRHPFLVTRSSVLAKQEELKRIVNEEITPEQHGDRRSHGKGRPSRECGIQSGPRKTGSAQGHVREARVRTRTGQDHRQGQYRHFHRGPSALR